MLATHYGIPKVCSVRIVQLACVCMRTYSRVYVRVRARACKRVRDVLAYTQINIFACVIKFNPEACVRR